jgi:hypothetical protein
LTNLDFSRAHGLYLTVDSPGESVNTSCTLGLIRGGVPTVATPGGPADFRTWRENLVRPCYILNNGPTGV